MNIQGPSSASASPPSNSLYHESFYLIERLYSISGFEFYLFPNGIEHLMHSAAQIDPVSILQECFRLGVPLCHLYNQNNPQLPLEIESVQHGVYGKTSKKALYHFITSCKEVLGLHDQTLGITDLYKDDTSGFVKMLRIVRDLLAVLEAQNLMPPKRPLPFNTTRPGRNSGEPLDNRSKVIKELLETERSYITSLEELQNYATEVQNYQLLTRDEMRTLFSNLSELLDFQRRFLIAMEQTLAASENEQRIGLLFLQHESAFHVYEPFCGNYKTGSQLILSEASKLERLSHIIEPTHGLPSYLIRPVQRICKYPLLLKEIIKLSDEKTYPYVQELKDGLEAAKRITETVNEQKRLEENRELKKDLAERITDLKGLNMDDFGELILSDKFPMQSNGVESDYNLYLFENILLCCKEYRKKKKKKGSKEVIPLSLKGNIYITSIGGVQDTSTPDTQQFCLQVYWRDGTEMETSALTCRNIEQVKLWHDRLERLIAAERSRRRSMMDVATRGMSRMNVSSVDDDNDDTAEAEYSLSPTGLVMPSRRKSEANLHVEAAAAASAAYALNANYPGSPSVNRTRVMAPWEASPQSPSQQSIASSSSPPSRKSIPATPRGSSLAGANEYIQQLNNYHRPPSTTLSTQSINAQQALSSSFTGSTTTATIGSNQYHHRSTSDSPSSPFNTAAAAGNLATSSSSPPSRYIAMPPPPTHQPPPPPPNLRSSLSSMSISGGSSSSSALPTPPVSTPGSPRMRPGPSGNHPPPHIVTRSSSTYSSNGVQGDTYNIPHQPASSSTSPSQFVQNFYSNDSGNTSQHHGNNYNSNRFSRSTSGAISDAEARLNARRQLLRASAPAPPPAGFGPPPSIPLPPPPSSGNSQTVSPPSSGGSIGGMVTASYQIRIKLHFGSDVFLLAVPYPGCLFVDFQSKVERKIRYSGAQRPEGQPLLMKYRDEEGDLINISNDSDVALALYYAAQSGRNDLQVFIT